LKNEIRRDYILEKYSIVAANTNLSYKNFAQMHRLASDPAGCIFCSHNVHSLPSIIEEVQNMQKEWKIRVVPNINESVTPEGNPILRTDNVYFTWAQAYGREEIIIESPNHYEDFGDLHVDIIELNIKKYIQRINVLEKTPYVAYVALFKNQGFNAGSHTTHSHSQLMTMSVVPTSIQKEKDALEKFKREFHFCPHCDLINTEKKSLRRIFETNTFVSFSPYSSDFPFEVRIYPKKHLGKLSQLSDQEVLDLANTFKTILSKLNTLNYPAYNIVYITAPIDGGDFHFYIRIIPRLSKRAGFELVTDTMVNPISPEDAAKFYRGE
jgi:UDPglucose--hexose-1-phosphate uridylyltransferase